MDALPLKCLSSTKKKKNKKKKLHPHQLKASANPTNVEKFDVFDYYFGDFSLFVAYMLFLIIIVLYF